MLARVAPAPVVTLSRAVALATVLGPRAGLALLGTLDIDDHMARTHRLERAGDPAAAGESYLQRTRKLPIG